MRQPADLGAITADMSGVAELDRVFAVSDWTVPGLLLARSEHSPEAPALWSLAADGQWEPTDWRSYRQAVASLSSSFRKLGLTAGEPVGIMAPACREWDFAQLGVLAAGGVAVGLDPYALGEQLCAIARRCGFVGLVVADRSYLDRFDANMRQQLRFAVCLRDGDDDGVISLATLLAPASAGDDWNLALPDAPATIVFTSGTTGEPKGIEYSHRQICLAASAILSAFPQVGAESRLACWLPLSNLFQRMINLSAIARGAQTFYVSDPREIMRYVKFIAPHLFIGVPRFYEKLQAGIDAVIEQQPAWQRRMVRWALRVGQRHAAASRAGEREGLADRLAHVLADWLALSRIRGALGPNLRFMVSGSAPMPGWLLERLHAIGLPVLEAYGVSENVIPIAINRPDRFRFGTVGQPAPGSEVRLAEDGELLVRGAGVFSGYLGAEKPAPALLADGYLATGDLATIDGDGFITLIGRKSEIFKTSTGRRIAPAGIESGLQQIPQIEHAVVFGAGRARPVALLVVSEGQWQAAQQNSFSALRAQVAAVSEQMAAYQRPAGLIFSAQALTIDAGELTTNLKLRRQVIEAKHRAVLHELYARIDAAPGSRFEGWSADHQIFYCES